MRKLVDLPSYNNNPLRLRSTTFANGIALTSSNIRLVTLDIDGTVFLHDTEFIQRIRSRRILHITTSDIKTRYHRYHTLPLTKTERKNGKGKGAHTSMPRTSNPPIRRDDAILQRRPVVRTARTHGMHLVIEAEDEHLSALDAVDLTLDLFHVGDVR